MARRSQRRSLRKSNRRSLHRRSMKGGVGAADHAIATFGGIGQQTAVAGSNVIAMNSGVQVAPVDATPMKGGNRAKKGGDLTAVTVPALLLYANHAYKPKSKTVSNKHRVSVKNITGKKYRK